MNSAGHAGKPQSDVLNHSALSVTSSLHSVSSSITVSDHCHNRFTTCGWNQALIPVSVIASLTRSGISEVTKNQSTCVWMGNHVCSCVEGKPCVLSAQLLASACTTMVSAVPAEAKQVPQQQVDA